MTMPQSLIGYSGMSQIHPQNLSFPLGNLQPHLIHPSLDRRHTSPQTPLTTPNGIQIQSAVLPQYALQADRPTDGIGEKSVPTPAFALLNV